MGNDSWSKMVSRLAVRQPWPRNFKFGRPKSLGLPDKMDYPSNVKYGQPRNVDRSNIDDTPPDSET